jgi:hypothetical protein
LFVGRKIKSRQLKRRGNSGVTVPTPSHASIWTIRSRAAPLAERCRSDHGDFGK